MKRSCLAVCGALTLLALLASVARGGDWPCYQADANRSGTTDERLSFPLAPAWRYQAAAVPQPAWPEPGRTLHLMDFDYAFQPVAAGGLVFFASSADDAVRALDQQTGQERWRFATRGPVRFAPHIADGRCFVAGDDGYVYCLEAATGKLVWEFRAAPEGRLALGNGRMISRTPCRSGVLVADGVAYVTAGMWPSEGVLVYALDAASGKVLWCNDTTGWQYLGHPHASASFGGPAPQGYLLASKDVLVVPTGATMPAGFDRRTGKLLFCQMTPGGSWATIIGDVFFTTRIKSINADRDIVQIGENGPNDGDGLEAHSLATGEPQWNLAEAYRALTKTPGEKSDDIRFGMVNRQLVVWRKPVLYTLGEGVIEAIDCSTPGKLQRIWSIKHPRAYSAVLSGEHLIVGGAGTIVALQAADGKEAWHAEADGQVRGLAISNQRLLATTEKGAILCFGGTPAPAPAAAAAPAPAAQAAHSQADKVLAGLASPEQMKGYALVLGEPDARLAEALAARTQLHVECILADKAKAAAERDRLLAQTPFYGRRIAIHHLPPGEPLPFAAYFANLVVISGDAAGVPAASIYGVLRPCGGRMVFTGDASAASKLIADAGIPQAELQKAGEMPVVIRGKLAGAFDWDSKVDSDQRVRWPLELIWFGGPGPNRMVARHWKAPTPVFANGRYIAIGEYHLIGVDAYNGCELWCRQVGGGPGYKTLKLSADDQSVYLNFADFGAQLDAQTGALVKLYGRPKPSQRMSLDKPLVVPVMQLTNRLGAIGISRTPAALEVTINQEVADTGPKDLWVLNFDFRTLDRQFSDRGNGAFRMRLTPADGTWQPGLGGPAPRLSVTKEAGASGNKVVVSIPWDAIRELVGADPAEFRFAATFQRDEPKMPQQKIQVYADGLATFVNEGWATIVLDAPRASKDDALPVPVASAEELPAFARDWPRQPPQFTADWTLDAYDSLELKQWPPVDRGEIPALRTDPITGKSGWRTYTKSHGCGGTVASATVDFFRSGTVGIYDRTDDSGLRNFAGIRPGCGTTIIPAGGVLISSEGQADCTCSFTFQTSFAMAPVATRRQEDWALFDASMSTSLIRGLALNLGAPGDRRDEQGTLWLGYPRPPVAVGETGGKKPGKQYTFAVPCDMEFQAGFGPYRVNADRATPRGTDRPWIYASGARGLKKATLNLLFGEPESALAIETKQKPSVDGALGDACWNGLAAIEGADQKSSVYLRYDADNLYIASRRAGGKSKDMPLQITLREDGEPRFAQFGVAADGARSSARFEGAMDIPRSDGIAIDGKAEDWKQDGLPLALPGGGQCRVAWNDEGLLMLTELPRDFSAQSPEATGLLAMAVQPSSWSFLQFAVDAKTQAHTLDQRLRKASVRPAPPVARNISGLMHWGHPFGELLDPPASFRAVETKTDKAVIVETLFPWSALGVKPAIGQEVPFQVIFYDPAKVDPKFPKGGDWRPQILADAKGLGRLRLAAKTGESEGRTVSLNQRYGTALACVVTPDAEWKPEWSAAAKVDGDVVTVEAAIPWKALEQAGFHKEKLRIDVGDAVKMKGPASQVSQEFDRAARVICWEKPVAASRPYTVRLHFCEPGDAAPGQRIFDVKLQGKTVLADLDIAKAAGGPQTALVKEFSGVMAEQSIVLELVPKSAELSEKTAPVLSGIEVLEE